MLLRRAVIALLVLFCVCIPIRAADPASEYEGKVYSWLKRHQGASGLVGNQEGDNLSGLYANSLAALCFLHEGDIPEAEKIFHAIQEHYTQCFEAPGGFFQFW